MKIGKWPFKQQKMWRKLVLEILTTQRAKQSTKHEHETGLTAYYQLWKAERKNIFFLSSCAAWLSKCIKSSCFSRFTTIYSFSASFPCRRLPLPVFPWNSHTCSVLELVDAVSEECFIDSVLAHWLGSCCCQLSSGGQDAKGIVLTCHRTTSSPTLCTALFPCIVHTVYTVVFDQFWTFSDFLFQRRF